MTYSEYRKGLYDIIIDFYNFELERYKDKEFDAEFLEFTLDEVINLNRKNNKKLIKEKTDTTKKQFLVEIECKENEPELVTAMGIEVCLEDMIDGFIKGLIDDNWTVNVSKLDEQV